MRLGIFARTFERPTLEATLDAVAAHGLDAIQLNLSCAGLPSLPERIEPAQSAHIRAACAERGIAIAAVSGTFNMIDPDLARRREGLRRLRVLAEALPAMGASIITLCTGTRDPDDMWRWHPENASVGAWHELVESLGAAVHMAEQCGVTLAFEPEVANVVDSAARARRLLDEIDSPRLRVVLDAANLFHAGELPRMAAILDEAVALLGRDIAIAHAKDLSRDGAAGHEAAGTGLLDYDRLLALLRGAGFNGPLILHSLSEQQVPAAVAFLRGKLT